MTSATDAILPIHQFTVEEYHRMGQLGLFEDKHVELIHGKVIDRSPINPKHASAVKALNNWLRLILSKDYMLGVQDPFHIDDRSEPEPDISVLKYREDCYAEAHPTPEDVFLLIEVADSSLDKDQRVKLPLYAQAGILEVWIVNLTEGMLEQYLVPTAGGYQQIHTFKKGQTLEHSWIGAVEIDTFLKR